MSTIRKATIFVILISVALLGVKITTEVNTPQSISQNDLLEIIPETIDLGQLSSVIESQEFSFQIENKTDQECKIEIQPGCGCTAINNTRVLIPANSSHHSTATVTFGNRVGPFHEVICVFSELASDSSKKLKIDLLVHAHIINQWQASPARLILHRGGEANLTITAPVIEWADVVLAPIGCSFTFEQVSVDIRDEMETRHYRVTADSTNILIENRGIGLHRADTEKMFFTLPILID